MESKKKYYKVASDFIMKAWEDKIPEIKKMYKSGYSLREIGLIRPSFGGGINRTVAFKIIERLVQDGKLERREKSNYVNKHLALYQTVAELWSSGKTGAEIFEILKNKGIEINKNQVRSIIVKLLSSKRIEKQKSRVFPEMIYTEDQKKFVAKEYQRTAKFSNNRIERVFIAFKHEYPNTSVTKKAIESLIYRIRK